MFRKRPARFAAGQYATGRRDTGGASVHFIEDGERPRRQRDAVLAVRLHPRRRHRPNLVEQVNLVPAGAYHFTRSRGREDGKFESAGCDALLLAQARQEGRQLGVGERWVMFNLAHL